MNLVLQRVEDPGNIGVGVAVKCHLQWPIGAPLPSVRRSGLRTGCVQLLRRASKSSHLAKLLVQWHGGIRCSNPAQDDCCQNHPHILVFLMIFVVQPFSSRCKGANRVQVGRVQAYCCERPFQKGTTGQSELQHVVVVVFAL